jgi:hypothetical protein
MTGFGRGTGSSSTVHRVGSGSSRPPVALPLGYLVALVRSRLDRSAVGELVVELERGVPTGGLTVALRRALGDPSATLAFQVAGSDRFVDSDGMAVDLSAQGADRSVTYLDGASRPTITPSFLHAEAKGTL